MIISANERKWYVDDATGRVVPLPAKGQMGHEQGSLFDPVAADKKSPKKPKPA